MRVHYVPTYEPTPSAFRDGNAMHAREPEIYVEGVDTNHVRIAVGGVSKLVDGVSLCNAINTALAEVRRSPLSR